jgi:hypothetical protein
MRKTLYSAMAVIFLFAACQKNSKETVDSTEDLAQIDQRSCASNEVLEQQMTADPSIRDQMNLIEARTRRIIESKEVNRIAADGTIEIPVVVHVLAKTKAEDISLAQIQSQIDVLNEDFNLNNADASSTPALFSGVKANIGVHFTLNNVIRKATNKKSWAPNDAMKKSSQGGSSAINPDQYLNIWVCNLGQNLLGYATFPTSAGAWNDGVVILYSAFGRQGTLITKYNKGRTATHEVGHWMNLRHIWGDATCGTDFVGDTPLHNTANYNCPAYPHMSTCGPNITEMTMNYMDYTEDACMYMFTNGQKDRMLSVFASGMPRASFIQ